MTLIEALKNYVSSDCKISFTSFAFQLIINMQMTRNDVTYTKESWLPLSDHCYDERLADCIKWMHLELIKEMEQE